MHVGLQILGLEKQQNALLLLWDAKKFQSQTFGKLKQIACPVSKVHAKKHCFGEIEIFKWLRNILLTDLMLKHNGIFMHCHAYPQIKRQQESFDSMGKTKQQRFGIVN